MAERDIVMSVKGSVLLVGAGRRARQTAAVLAALSSLDPEGERRSEPLPELGVADLEELMAQRPLQGLLILESGRVPNEDIGFVRRFLERHPGWRLLVVGQDKSVSLALLSLTRAQWLGWPPNLEELQALLAPPAPVVAEAAARDTGTGAPRKGTPRRPRRSGSEPQNGGVDVSGLLEELLAGAALQGEPATRFQFRGSPFLVHQERAPLSEGLSALVEFARLCAGDGLVRVETVPNGDHVQVDLVFPQGALSEKDLPELLEPPVEGASEPEDPELALSLTAARHAAELLRELGCRVEIGDSEPGRVRCALRLAAHPAPVSKGSAGKPEDPFA